MLGFLRNLPKASWDAKSLEFLRIFAGIAGQDNEIWKTKIGPQIPDLLDREKMVITRIVPTSRSTMQ